MSICENDALTNMDGLSALTSVGGLGIWDNAALTNLDGLSALTTCENGFSIFDNDILPDCEACPLLDQITTDPPPEADVHDNLNDTCTPVPTNCP